MPAEEDFQRFSELAEEIGLDEKDRDEFIGFFMTRKGYRAIPTWTDGEPEGDGGGSFFNKQQQRRETRQIPRGQQGGGRSGGSNWQYGS